MKRRRRCHRRKGFDADGGAFTLELLCFALLCSALLRCAALCCAVGVVWCGAVRWALGRVGAGNGDLSLK